MSIFFIDMPTLRHHAFMWGIKITTIGVLFKNAEINATAGSMVMYPNRADCCVG